AFPRLMVNVVNGGKHAGWNFDIQEFMVIPKSNIPTESTRIATEIFQALGSGLKKQKLSTLVGDEGGYSPALSSNEAVLGEILSAAQTAGYENVKDFRFALDCAATEFFEDGKYLLKKTNETKTPSQMIEYYQKVGQEYNIESFEDPFAEDDWDTFRTFSELAEQFKFTVVGDDLFVTNPERIQKGIDMKSANAVLIKLNQIGSVLETVQAIKMTQAAGWKVAVSHRSGETEDSFIADLAYGAGADFIKTGSMSRSERLAKYNRLLEIEQGM
nr:phosphopyruvate hydratase [Candidatus Woesebacteria bacterium]